MKLNTLQLLALVSLLSIGNISYAAGTTSTTQKNEARVNVDKLADESNAHGRSIGGALANKAKATESNDVNPDKKRIAELEDLVSQQQKLIDIYKKQGQ